MAIRAYLSVAVDDLPSFTDEHLFGELNKNSPFAIEPAQRTAWHFQISHLRQLASALPGAHFFVEFLIPRMGRRADLVVHYRGIVFVVEYKIGAEKFERSSLDQVQGYALDLKYFHESSHAAKIVPILVASRAQRQDSLKIKWSDDGLASTIKCVPNELPSLIRSIGEQLGALGQNPLAWAEGGYRPTPTIVEAAQALYRGHNVQEISRSEAGAENLTRTADTVSRIIEDAKQNHRKVICFITGVPGSGKTLAGLNLATLRQRTQVDENAVFLSGNGPLVEVLREALSLDALMQAKELGKPSKKSSEEIRAKTFVQNIHHFRDDALTRETAPAERVAVFDEAQRAWDAEQTKKFMQAKKGRPDFQMSEPEFLLSVMDRHPDWCAIICLVGGGQEINTGEAGIQEWLHSVKRSFPYWNVHLPESMKSLVNLENVFCSPDLHLATSVRSFRAELLADFVDAVIEGDSTTASGLKHNLQNYPLFVTRSLGRARVWLDARRRGVERAGLLASSNAMRLKPDGIFVKASIEPAKWFLAPTEDVRSSNALEDAATEFEVQGLELDWACLCWDANLVHKDGTWRVRRFRGTKWEDVQDDARRRYVMNSYRVLLTRARQGLVVFVPEGSSTDETRNSQDYDAIFEYLRECGFDLLW